MNKQKLLAASVILAAPLGGCAVKRCGDAHRADLSRISIRFTAPPGSESSVAFADRLTEVRLAGDESDSDDAYGYSEWTNDSARFHVSLWGGRYHGEDVTYQKTSLTPGPYQFGLFDSDEDAIYQGWINVNHGSDSTLDVLREWLDTVRREEVWLGFEKKIEGKFTDRDTKEFKQYRKELKRVRRLARRIESAIDSEIRDRQQQEAEWNNVLAQTEILLLPGTADITRPSTRSAFHRDELDQARRGTAVTKYILLADRRKAADKLGRINEIRDELRRCRVGLSDEVDRLGRQRRLFTITGHLYDHSGRFAENRRRTAKALTLIDDIDRQLADHHEHCVALTFLAGMSSDATPTDAFANERHRLERDRVVLEEKKRQVDLRFEQTAEDSVNRVRILRERQTLIARLETLNGQIGHVDRAVVALGTLSKATAEIHRHGHTRVLAATVWDGDIPDYLVDAIERNSVMTVRLQSTDAVYAPEYPEVASALPCEGFEQP